MKFHWSDWALGVITGAAVVMAIEVAGLIEGWW